MIVDANAHDQGGLGDPPGRVDIALARLVVARRMVVDEDDAGRAHFESALDDLARVSGRLADRALPDQVVGHQLVLRGEEEHPEPLVDQIGHVRLQIVEQLLGGGDDRPLGERQAQAVQQRRLDAGEEAGRLPADGARALGAARRQRRRQRAEFGDQGVGPGGGVAGPGGPEERIQEGSAPFLISRRWWANVPATISSSIG